MYNNKLYKYTALPNGLSTCPRALTKLMKPPLATLRVLNHIISGYIDDFYLQGNTYHCCAKNAISTIKLFDFLGLVTHPDKCSLIPKQEIVMLGFLINSVLMTVRLTPEKIQKIKALDKKMKESPNGITIQQLAKVIGYIVSSLPGV